jgi:hypothetical protein
MMLAALVTQRQVGDNNQLSEPTVRKRGARSELTDRFLTNRFAKAYTPPTSPAPSSAPPPTTHQVPTDHTAVPDAQPVSDAAPALQLPDDQMSPDEALHTYVKETVHENFLSMNGDHYLFAEQTASHRIYINGCQQYCYLAYKPVTPEIQHEIMEPIATEQDVSGAKHCFGCCVPPCASCPSEPTHYTGKRGCRGDPEMSMPPQPTPASIPGPPCNGILLLASQLTEGQPNEADRLVLLLSF